MARMAKTQSWTARTIHGKPFAVGVAGGGAGIPGVGRGSAADPDWRHFA